MVVLIIFPVILQIDINVIMLSIGGQGAVYSTNIRSLIHTGSQNKEKETTTTTTFAKFTIT